MFTRKKTETAYFIAKKETPLTKFENSEGFQHWKNFIIMNQVMLITTITCLENLWVILPTTYL